MMASRYFVLACMTAALSLQACATPGGSQAAAVAPPDTVAAPMESAGTTGTAAIPQVDGKPVVKADTRENFEAIVAAVRQQMQPGGRWQYIDPSERADIDSAFADMAVQYAKFGRVDQMDKAALARLVSDQTTVNAILTHKDGDRLVCKSEMPVGSHIPVRTCRTFAQMENERHNALEYMRKLQATPQLQSGK